ncbi:MAG TPA: tRNA (guanosine(37)-N1)-methyltransferase TrmD [Polyangiaceae bacterium]
MRIGIVTLFPDLFEPFLRLGFVGKAIAQGQLEVCFENLRDHGLGVHKSVDDTPYGGGSGMVMRVDCLMGALESAQAKSPVPLRKVLLTPQGRPFRQPVARELARHAGLLLVCGRYEGFDERIRLFVDDEISLGDFVMTGGEVAAMAITEACVRLLPGVLGNEASIDEESFSESLEGMLEYPQYTRPATFRGLEVPEVLKGGDHAKVASWRRQQARERTHSRRPELVPAAEQDPRRR